MKSFIEKTITEFEAKKETGQVILNYYKGGLTNIQLKSNKVMTLPEITILLKREDSTKIKDITKKRGGFYGVSIIKMIE